jgi:hypothetical protein
VSLSSQYEAMHALAAWVQDHAEDIRADLIRAAEDAEKTSPDIVAQLGEYGDGDERDMMLMAMHAWSGGFLRGFESARDAQVAS